MDLDIVYINVEMHNIHIIVSYNRFIFRLVLYSYHDLLFFCKIFYFTPLKYNLTQSCVIFTWNILYHKDIINLEILQMFCNIK